jgi:hypothetical protein
LPRRKLLFCTGLAVLILAARLHVVARCAASMPFWDEWDADLMALFLPPASGRPGLAALFAVHNEHRIVLTRLLDLALFWLQGRHFDVLTGMIINQAAFSIFGVALLVYLGRELGEAARATLLLAGAAVWANPFGWQAITWSFESQIYMCIMLSVLAFALIARAAPNQPAFWVGILAACLSVISFGAGIATVATVMVLVAAHHLPGPHWRKACAALAILAAVLAAGIIATPTGNDLHLTHSWMMMAKTALAVLAWPRGPHSPAFIYWPAACLLGWGIWRKPVRDNFFWFVLAVAIWQAGLAVQIAISRYDDPISSRYTELLILGIVSNLACVLRLGVVLGLNLGLGRLLNGALLQRAAWVGLAGAWLVLLVMGVVHRIPVLTTDIAAKRSTSFAEAFDVARYLKTGDMAFMRPPAVIPYHTPDALAAELRASIASDSPDASNLPPSRPPASDGTGLFVPNLLDGDTPKGGKWRKHLGHIATGAALAGIMLLMLAAVPRPARMAWRPA